MIEASVDAMVPDIPNPDGRQWHALTLRDWAHACRSPMASQWIETDWDGIGRLAILWDEFYKRPNADTLKEIRLQNPAFGLTPLDRSRLQWEVGRGEEAERKRVTKASGAVKPGGDLRKVLRMVSG
jgi:hypothetical protein